jgi:NAD(P)-dependent dehydrogenase (short-subunit alcohol dehydrogenase family)
LAFTFNNGAPHRSATNTMASYFITGTSRGVGLKLTEILASKPASEVSIIFAAARTETDALKALAAKFPGRIEIVSIDVTSENSAKQAASKVEQLLGDKGLDVLINNAGIMNYTPDGIETMLVDNLRTLHPELPANSCE